MIFVTMSKWTQLDDDRIAFVRRYDSKFSSLPIYERIILNRKDKTVEECILDDQFKDKIAEKSVYKAEGDSILYETFLYKNPGWKSYLRRKAHSWGIDRMNQLLIKEKENFVKRAEMMLAKTEERMTNIMKNRPLNNYI